LSPPSNTNETGDRDASVRAFERPHPRLLTLYALRSLAATIAAPIVFVPLYFRYHTLRYRIGDEGISAAWGILSKREVHLTYKRIQDIHVSRSLLERWLGIATVEIQTAAGSSRAELSVEGVTDHEALRDFLYRRMRGHETAPAAEARAGAPEDEVVALLRSIRSDLERARAALERAS
jgi:putative membrane protein